MELVIGGGGGGKLPEDCSVIPPELFRWPGA